MAAIASTDLTYTIESKEFLGPKSGFRVIGSISFGNGSLTYPSGGVPLTKAKMGLPRVIKSISIMETNAVGYFIEFDKSAEKLRLLQVPEIDADPAAVIATQPLDEATTSEAPAAMVVQFEATGY